MIGPSVFYERLQQRIPGWCKIRNIKKHHNCEANPSKSSWKTVLLCDEVTPLEAPHATPHGFSHSNGRGPVRRGSSKYAENVDPEATGQLGEGKTEPVASALSMVQVVTFKRI
jgi:hypothetical protein